MLFIPSVKSYFYSVVHAWNWSLSRDKVGICFTFFFFFLFYVYLFSVSLLKLPIEGSKRSSKAGYLMLRNLWAATRGKCDEGGEGRVKQGDVASAALTCHMHAPLPLFATALPACATLNLLSCICLAQATCNMLKLLQNIWHPTPTPSAAP